MPKKKKEGGSKSNLRVGNLSDIGGDVNIAGGNITTHHTTSGLSAAEIRQIFSDLYKQIDALPETPPAHKEDIKAEVQEIQTTVTDAAQKDENVDESFVARRFRNIARMAPDVLDVIVASVASPLAGVGVAVEKVAAKAREETK